MRYLIGGADAVCRFQRSIGSEVTRVALPREAELAMADLPTGTVTFLFTDIEGSTRLWAEHRGTMGEVVERHDIIVRSAIEDNGGFVFATGGDAFSAAFPTAQDALAAAVMAQIKLTGEDWGTSTVRVRMGIHTGEALERDEDYFGPVVNESARLMSAGHGGQILISETAASIASDAVPDGVALIDLGQHRLRDVDNTVRVFQVTYPGLDDVFPGLRTESETRHNLPNRLASFVGRNADLEELGALVMNSRLVTLTGPGGSGKTTLATEFARGSLDSYPDGVWFVDLAAIDDGALVTHAVASVLDIRERPGRPLRDSVITAAGAMSILLILDNCEHLVDAAAELVGALVRSTRGVDILATSREPLRVPGETVFGTQPLETPSSDGSREEIAESPAVRLFVDRARMVLHDFALTPANASAVGRVCRSLDGLPLAIEMAAARVNALTPTQIADRLDERFALLSSGSRDGIAQHQSLRAAIEWSYELLDNDEKAVFRRVSVFDSDFSIDAAESVCSPLGTPVQVADIVSRLVDKSMIARADTPAGLRLRLLETIREYSREKLEELGEAQAAARDHFAHYTGWFESLRAREPRLRLTREEVQAIDSDLDNVRSAFRWGVETNRIREVGALAASMWAYWWARGWGGEAYGWYEVLDDNRSQLDPEDLVGVLHALGTIHMSRSEFDDESEAYLLAELAAYEQYGVAAPAAGVPHHNLGVLASAQQDWSRALDWWAQTIEHTEKRRDSLTMVYYNMGTVHHVLGDIDTAERFAHQSIEQQRRDAERFVSAYPPVAKDLLAEIALDRGNPDEARRWAAELRRESKDVDLNSYVAASVILSSIAIDQGDLSWADALLTEAVTVAAQAGIDAGLFREPAVLRQAQESPYDATVLAAVASTDPPGLKRHLSRLEDTVTNLETTLDHDHFTEAWDLGSTLTPEEAAAYFQRRSSF